MRAFVLGVGRMGTAIAYAMDKLGFHVVGMDTNPEAANNIPKKVNLEDGETPNNEFFVVDDAADIIKGLEGTQKPDIVISSLPYHQTGEVAMWCIENGVRYCDLGGRVDVSEAINIYAKEKATAPVFTDLGLAPGWVNIVAEQGYKSIHAEVEDVKMMVGGIPAIKTNPPLNYALTWSIDGLINEYRDICRVWIDGVIHDIPGMNGLEKVNFKYFEDEPLEAFYTSGGASHSIESMSKRGVKNVSYKTIRYAGHKNMVELLIRKSGLSDEELKKVFTNCCPNNTGDVVLIKVELKGGDLTWNKEIIIGYDQQFSAMQKATAFSISSMAALMAEGIFDNRVEQNRGGDIKLPLVLNYSDVPFDKFNENLKKLGIQT